MFRKIADSIKIGYLKFDHWMSYQPPGSLSSDGWYYFRKEFKQRAPIRYWYKNTFKRKYIYPIGHFFNRKSQWIRYNLIKKRHIIDTGLKPGYREIDELMLYANFKLLAEYVEVELALVGCENNPYLDYPWHKKILPFYGDIFPYRDANSGIKYLEDLIDSNRSNNNLSPSDKHLPEILALYIWWTQERPNRKNLLKPYPEVRYDSDNIFMPHSIRQKDENYQKVVEARDFNGRLEDKWEEEDQENLERLIKIRKHLWI